MKLPIYQNNDSRWTPIVFCKLGTNSDHLRINTYVTVSIAGWLSALQLIWVESKLHLIGYATFMSRFMYIYIYYAMETGAM